MNPLIKYALVAMGISPIWVTPDSVAAPITRDIQSASGVEDARANGGYFEVGAVAHAQNQHALKWNDEKSKSDVGLGLNLGYQWRGFFIDINDDERFAIGYNAVNTDHWSFDLVAGIASTDFNRDRDNPSHNLQLREGAANAGLRATGFYGNSVLQFDLRQAQNHDFKGYEASVLAGTGWQVRNFNFHGVVGAHYGSQQIANYYWGVRPDEASPEYPQYTATDLVTGTFELGLTYPLSQRWLFKSKLNYFYVPDALYHSPIRADESRHFLNGRIAIYYVF